MTKLRFYLNLIFIPILTLVSLEVAGMGFSLVVDTASFVLIILIPFIIISFIYSPKEQIKMNSEILKSKSESDKTIIENSLLYLNSFKKIIIYCSIIWTLMGFIGIGAYSQDPRFLGPNFAVALIVPFYAAIFMVIYIEPLRASAEKKLKA